MIEEHAHTFVFNIFLAAKQTPPYVDPNIAAGYEQNQMSSQPPPPVEPRDEFPKS